ncbi:phosphatidylinositol-specific phospholipase C domain-containing protein (plasmid) [Bacillus mycoides]|uniref:phosphatidylinositol-specific phospholipase C domain-containing protein n=1 Tax=Bacillus mycoides TaxID=1405 RepID=UPI001C01A196|nr:phosphatidylinositol-specific phospholipase C domain-containing protein [Bacillus mycoides]QWH75487.1 phosphatidylinositol-specific phospholipase C domain-containing protein [Bacillus mycoides]
MKETDLLFLGPRPSRIHNGPNYYGRTALERTGVNFTSSLSAQNPRWMSSLNDSLRISELSIPGTHGSMALFSPLNLISDYVINQTANLTTQLNAGIRYIDIRCRHANNLFPIHHGRAFQHAWFDSDVLRPIRTFLLNNPRETILMRVQQEYTPQGNTRSFEDTFAAYHSDYEDIFWHPTGSNNPTLGETRGRIVLLQQFGGPLFGINYGNLSIQDMWRVPNTSAMYDKWVAIRNHFNNAMNNRNRIHLNHLSGNGGDRNTPYPWKIASGYWFRSSDSQLEEVIPFNQSSNFRDWPRDTNRFIYRGGTNLLTTRRIENGSITHTGIIAADFPGSGLIRSTINLNTRPSNRLSGTYKIVTALNNSSVVDLNTINNNVALWSNHGGRHQVWDFRYDQQRDAYMLRNESNLNLVLAADPARTNNVFVYPINSNYGGQFWILEPNQGGYIFRNYRNRNLVLDVYRAQTANGTNITLFERNPAGSLYRNQTFFLQRV